MTLDPRLQAVYDEIRPCEVLADIGADHGKIAAAARLNNLARKVIASDISAASIEKARALAERYGLEIDIRVGKGVSVLKSCEYDTVVIAGMGGVEMASILSKAPRKFKRYIFAPHTKAEELRAFMSDNGISPERDYKVLSGGKFYDIIAAVPGEYCPDKDVLYYGYHENTPIFREFCVKERARLKKIIGSGGAQEYAERLAVLDYIERGLGEGI